MTRDDIRPPAGKDGSDDRGQADALDPAWDAWAGSLSPRVSPSWLTPERVRMLDQIQALAIRDAAAAPDTRARIWHSTRVMAGIPARREQGMVVPDVMPPAIAGPPNRMAPLLAGTGRPAIDRRRPFWTAIQVAAAAALVLAIIGTIVNARHDGGRHGAVVGGIIGTPSDPSAGGEAGVTLQQWSGMATVDASEPTAINLYHLKIRPGSAWFANASLGGPMSVTALAVSGRATIFSPDVPNGLVSVQSASADAIDSVTGTHVSVETDISPAELYVAVIGNGKLDYHMLPMYGSVELLGSWSGTQWAQLSSPAAAIPAKIPLDLRVRQVANGDGETLGSASGAQVAMLAPLTGEATLVRATGDVQVQQTSDDHGGTPVASQSRTLSHGTAVTALPGGTFHISSGSEPVTYLTFTAAPVAPITADSASASPSAGLANVTPTVPVETDLTADFPTTSPLTTEFYRLDLNANSSWDITPGPNGPLAVLVYAAAGSATLSAPGVAPVTVGTAAPDPVTGSIVGDGATITTTTQSATLYAAIIGHGPQNFDLVNVPGQVTVLGVSPDRSLVPSDTGCGITGRARIYMGLRQSYDGQIEPFEANPGTIMVQVMSGTATVTRQADEVIVVPASTATSGAISATLLTGSGVIARSGGSFLLTAQGGPLTYLLLIVGPDLPATSANATAVATHAIGTGCGATPETGAGL